MNGQDFESAFKQVGELVARVQDNEDRYVSSEYLEAEARTDLINKFFIALGWDVNRLAAGEISGCAPGTVAGD